MKKIVIVLVLLAAVAGVVVYSGVLTREPAQAADGQAATQPDAGRGGGRGGAGGGGRGGRGPAGPMTVETAAVTRASVAQQLLVVGNLIGDTTVAVVPRAAGRLEAIDVRLGDPVRRGQRIAKIEDYELQEQLKQQDAALEVSRATIRQREADLQLAQTNAERSRSLFARQLLPKQTLDDTEARLQSAQAQLDLARAQNTQSEARLDELKINLANTVITSPVNGFVARRAADPGAFVSPNAPVVDVVDIGRVRLVANIVEKDLRQVHTGDMARVEVDAFPAEMFMGRIARLSPVLDPSTRTAPMEIEISNPGFRLKPGMYARVMITTDKRKDAVVVPSNAVVDYNGRRGVFVAGDDETVTFRPVRVGIEQSDLIEMLDGVAEGDRVVTTGAAALRDGDRVVLADGRGGRRGAPPAAAATAGPAGAGADVAADRQFGGEGRRGRRGDQP
ncbi:MAG: efflux RND transporter periplasmic adaptor subunit [Acidobacteria bacterium]|nr:efflux RND transporter periplasmic adaptor subunit [Acidobacteriota bacterium]